MAKFQRLQQCIRVQWRNLHEGDQIVPCRVEARNISLKRFWFRAGVISISGIDFSTTRRLPTPNRVVSETLETSGQEFSERVLSNFGTLSVVDNTSTEKRSHLCANPKRFRAQGNQRWTRPWPIKNASCTPPRHKKYLSQRQGRPESRPVRSISVECSWGRSCDSRNALHCPLGLGTRVAGGREEKVRVVA